MTHHAGWRLRQVWTVARRLFCITVFSAAVLSPQAARAQALPSGWTAANVGSPALSGSARYSGGTFTIEGAGRDVWDPSDQFYFVYRQVTGDTTIVARVGSLENTHVWAKAGVMIRESSSSTSRHAFVLVSPGKGVAFHRRTSSGGSSTNTSASGTAPEWLKLERRGSRFTASRSSNGTSWTQISSVTISMASTVRVGLAVTSHNPSTRATATFTNVSVGAPSSLPSGWTHRDIGSPAVGGSASFNSTGFTVNGGGTDIWGTSDQLSFVYQQVSGDVDVIARVASLQGPHAWTKAGVMVRSSLAANSAHASFLTSVSKGHAFQRRPATGLSSLHTPGGTGAAPVWLKLERRGSAVTAFRSSNGTSWSMIDSQTLTLGSSFYVGLAVASHSTTASARAVFTNVTVTAADSGGSNQRPSVSLTAPVSGATYPAPASVTISASASDPDGSIARVDFYAGSTLVGSDTTSPYSVTWNNVSAGSYSLTAVARDHAGATTTSAARSILVSNPAPPKLAVFVPSSNHATAVTRYQLEIFTAGANPNTATPMATQDLGKPSIVNGECSADIENTIMGLPGGSYVATVHAIGPGGSSARALSQTFTR